jgi:galactose oxidase
MRLLSKTVLRYFSALFVVCLFLVATFKTLPWALPQLHRWNSNAKAVGRWEPTVSLPIVPVAAALLPNSGQVLLWAADEANVFSNGTSHTLVVIFDPLTNTFTERNISTTHHNMFCPGLSLDRHGRPVITGGSTSNHTSIFDETSNLWIKGPPLNTGRGYHSQVTLSDGRVFTIGGSWSGGIGNKNGEVLDPAQTTWSPLPGASSAPMLTHDRQGLFAADNHAWLFAWSNASVFQAGPSATMNWYDTRAEGRTALAGRRGADADAMNGNAVMYDAAAGKVLALGGAESYADAPASRAAHLLTLSSPFRQPTVEQLAPMAFPRAYVNSVVLPTGDVLVVGGATYARQWTDSNATLEAELWSPRTRRFTSVARLPVPRTYHSFAVLLPDGRVLVGGGGLCWEKCGGDSGEGVNHLDVQLYVPPYLFGRNGGLRVRPRIEEISDTRVKVGAKLLLTTDGDIGGFSIVRYGSATHSVNTDQRRVPLDFITIPASEAEKSPRTGTRKQYQVTLPGDPGIVIPGYWMLFAITDDGVPSVAERLLIETKDIDTGKYKS